MSTCPGCGRCRVCGQPARTQPYYPYPWWGVTPPPYTVPFVQQPNTTTIQPNTTTTWTNVTSAGSSGAYH